MGSILLSNHTTDFKNGIHSFLIGVQHEARSLVSLGKAFNRIPPSLRGRVVQCTGRGGPVQLKTGRACAKKKVAAHMKTTTPSLYLKCDKAHEI